MGRRPAATGDSAPAGGWSSGMHPPLSSSQSPLSSVSACGENCACSLAPPLPTARGAAGAPFGLAKRETGRARSKRKDRLDALRRVRASARRGSADRCKRRFWPAFGHAWAFCDFLNCRPVAGVPTLSGWLSHGIASLFAAAGCPSGELAQRADKGIGPYGDTVGLAHFVGADLRVGPCEGDEGHKPGRGGRPCPPASTSRHNRPGSA